MPILTGVDVLAIQKFVFGSNRLRDVLSASWIVDLATGEKTLTDSGVDPKSILLAAGGNAVLAFSDMTQARQWITTYTRWLYENAPGLGVAIAHQSYTNLDWGLQAVQVALAHAKITRMTDAPQLGLSVNAPCVVTGLPATDVDQGEMVSQRIKRLRGVVDDAKERWKTFLPAALPHAPGWTAQFPDEFDRLGRTTGETSLMGVVHVDGNSVGARIKTWLDNAEGKAEDKIRTQYKEWSGKIRGIGDRIIRSLVERIASRVYECSGDNGQRYCSLQGCPSILNFRLNGDKPIVDLPFRPILLGGDDLTFVCDGRIALDLAVAALDEFGKDDVPHLGDNGQPIRLTACAGIALVKVHTPFHRSYDLAEALCASAKRESRGHGGGSWLDWHIGSARPGDSVEEIRKREYGNSTQRPYPLAEADPHKSFRWLETDVLGPRMNGVDNSFRGAWLQSRNRIKRLAALCGEPDAVKRQVEAWRVADPHLKLPAILGDRGFLGDTTPLRDAVELLDIHLRLDQMNANAQS